MADTGGVVHAAEAVADGGLGAAGMAGDGIGQGAAEGELFWVVAEGDEGVGTADAGDERGVFGWVDCGGGGG